jgi:hypothetical protein
MTEPLVVASGITRLAPAQLDAAIGVAALHDGKSWHPDALSHGVHFECAEIEWVELEGVVSLLLLLERLKIAGIQASISLPTVTPQEIGLPGSPAVSRKNAVLQYLEYIRFREAAEIGHVVGPSVRFLSGNSSSDPQPSAVFKPEETTHHLYRYIFPLVWLSSKEKEHTEAVAFFLRHVIGEPARGVEPLDAAAIANVILYELIDNADRHAQSSGYALVAARVRIAGNMPRPNDFYTTDREYLEWLRRADRPFVEIVVGDSGHGVHRTLRLAYDEAVASREIEPLTEWSEDANVIGWALDRWSSRDSVDSRRGTRGLYRVNRVVTKYEGLLSLRSGTTVVAADHGGSAHDALRFVETRASTPGTTIRLWVPAFREATAPRSMPVSSANMAFRFVRLGALTATGITREARHTLSRALHSKTRAQPCVVGVVDGGAESREAIESALTQAVELRHPAALILFGLPGGWDLISGAIESVNLQHRRSRRADEHASAEHFEIWDPVLVVGASSSHRAWVGATADVRKILDILLDKGHISARAFTEILPDARRRGDVRRILRNDAALATIHAKGEITSRISFQLLADHVRTKLRRHILTHRAGVYTGPFVTPSLTTVALWLDVPQILANICTPVTALFVLADEVRQLPGVSEPAAVLTDSSSASPQHAELLRRFLNAERVEIIAGDTQLRETDGVRALEPGISVVVYADVISSGESIARCVAQAVRDNARVISVVCIVDGRTAPSDTLDFHGVSIPLISLTTADRHQFDNQRRNPAPTYISPITHQREPPYRNPQSPKYAVTPEQLSSLLKRTESLHFRHIANKILNRHFTLYLDPGRAMTDVKVVDAVVGAIERHRKSRGERSKGYELWHAGETGTSAISQLAQRVSDRLPAHTIRNVQRRSTFGRWTFSMPADVQLGANAVVILDWGAITGATIAGLVNLALLRRAKDILVVIFVSQLPAGEELFLQSVRALRVRGDTTDLQLALLHDIEPTHKVSARQTGSRSANTPLSITFLSRYEIEAYTPAACPACKQLNRMAHEQYPTSLLAQYAASYEARRLRRWRRDELTSGLAGMLGAPRLHSSGALWMAEFRSLLHEALASTQRREAVVGVLTQLAKQAASDTPLAGEVAALLHFLALETQWLSRPPLHFPQLRELLASICASVTERTDMDTDTLVSALVVYRTGAKNQFAMSFLHLFETVKHRPEGLAQLLYSAFTFITRPYVQSPGALRPLLDALTQIESTVRVQGEHVNNDVVPTLSALVARAEYEHARGLHERDSPARAWRQLRLALDNEHRKSHPSTVVAIKEMLPGPDAATIEAAVEQVARNCDSGLDADVLDWIRALDDEWTPCRRFLDRTILPLLGKLSAVLDGDDFASFVGPDTATRLRELVQSKASVAESEFGTLIRTISLNPERLLERRNWSLFRTEVLWYYEHVFRPEDSVGTPATLVEFLRSAPSVLPAVAERVLRATAGDWADKLTIELSERLSSTNAVVFCPTNLLQEIIKHLLRNAFENRTDHKTPGIRLSVRLESNYIKLLAGAWQTQVSANFRAPDHSGGLVDFDRRLKAFGGSVQQFVPPESGRYSFLTVVNFAEG